MKININPDHLKGGAVGWIAGIAYMTVWAVTLDRKRIRIFKRNQELFDRIVDEVWVYLPTEVKEKLQIEMEFYVISQKEDI